MNESQEPDFPRPDRAETARRIALAGRVAQRLQAERGVDPEYFLTVLSACLPEAASFDEALETAIATVHDYPTEADLLGREAPRDEDDEGDEDADADELADDGADDGGEAPDDEDDAEE